MAFANYPSLEGRVVFVTGGASGIGADMVRAFAYNGARVAFVDIQRDIGGALVGELGDAPHTAAFPASRPDRYRRPARFDRGGKASARADRRAHQQCGQ